MSKILVSGCLLGYKVRYDGNDKLQSNVRLQELVKKGQVISVCPEMAGGLPTPRPPAEIEPGRDGSHVLMGIARVVANNGHDVTIEYVNGAKFALALAKEHNIKIAILKANSPSCGVDKIYDGNFSKNIIDGSGVTAELLIQNGIKVFDENHIDEALDLISSE